MQLEYTLSKSELASILEAYPDLEVMDLFVELEFDVCGSYIPATFFQEAEYPIIEYTRATFWANEELAINPDLIDWHRLEEVIWEQLNF